ncbi:hypothetical protein BP6252_07620 [Coleophoma cylindrospora]|uniref:Methyltransferase type 11 domain-containing protein n=1 Tax=Coleophoma cylindrospora TaxID=1849047 RepID=A0A3D8RAI1_9HELO|nr:hypothetical protein BP6252_07620 [Coleophoma cylindrospora]
MASYQAGFDPPIRPGESRAKRLGTYMQAGPRRPEERVEDGAEKPRTKERRASTNRIPQVGYQEANPRQRMPANRSVSDTKVSGSRFGFGKPTTTPNPDVHSKSRNVLRRKPSSISQKAGIPHPTLPRAASSSPTKWSEPSADNYQSIASSLQPVEKGYTRTTIVRPTDPPVIPELDRYRSRPEIVNGATKFHTEIPHRIATQDLPPSNSQWSATPLYSGLSNNRRLSGYSGSGYSASPSTRFSESPGPGAYSRDTTPTSMSSQSPGLVAPVKPHTPRLHQASPATSRPPLTKRRNGSTSNELEELPTENQGLPSLTESLNSSSSNSTVKDGDQSKANHKENSLPQPPNPPPRKSSQKFKKSRSETQDSPSKLSKTPVKSVMGSPSTFSSPRQTSSAPSQKSATPPVRPSREGAPELQSLSESMTIIQSNLTAITFPQDRRRSGLPGSISQAQLVIPSQESQVSSRNPSPSPIYGLQREPTPKPAGLGIVQDQVLQPGESYRAPSPSVANSRSRFGLFGRRTKTAREAPGTDNKEKITRKGPAAGTGHEGYGRYGLRGRSSSANPSPRLRDRSLSAARSSSEDSFASTRACDPFLLERMSPVVIAGGGSIIENLNTSSELGRNGSNTGLLLGNSVDIKAQPYSSSRKTSNEASRATLWPSAMPKEDLKRTSGILSKVRRASDSSEDGFAKRPSLAFRRSMQKLNNSTGALPLKFPKPLNIPGGIFSPSTSSLDTSVVSDESQLESNLQLGRGRELSGPRKLAKRAKSPEKPKKWNFFHRSQKTPDVDLPPQAAVKVTVNKTTTKAVPHYAMMDSSDDQPDTEAIDLEDILREAEVVDLTDQELDALQFDNYKANLQRLEEVKIERPPELAHLAEVPTRAARPDTAPITPEMLQAEFSLKKDTVLPRPSRLPQVGRIPNVIRARPEQTSPKSFSRPFARISTLQPLQGPLILDKESVALGPSPPKSSTPEPNTSGIQGKKHNSGDSKSSSAGNSDFIRFSPRKNSSGTTSSSGGMSFANIVAVVPTADAELHEDEVWNEYDDLIDRDSTPRVPPSATSSHGVPFQYEQYESRDMKRLTETPKESPTLNSTPIIKDLSPTRESSTASSSVYSREMNSRLKEALQTIPSPTTPISFTDFFAGYGDRNNSVGGESSDQARPSSENRSRKSTPTAPGSRTSSDSRIISLVAQDDSSPIHQVNLRVGSMTVSKWLTFGHVLFSPAREEMMQLDSSKHHSILVIDGLGNDDWSFYAAETYPNATFYNLSPTRPISSSQRTSTTSFPLTPDNHRQVQYTNTLDRFPFPRDNFSVVVVRFPTAGSEASYRNIVAESKRVLKPAGYLELSILDLDMMNMGNRARRAVRGLKVKMQVADPRMSLASASDTFLRLIGKRGFHDIKSCKVGVPVASVILASSTTSDKEKGKGKVTAEEKQERAEMSLADMMKDDSEAGDEGITRMVAKVGRWWYTRCYEMGVMPDGDFSRSIFNDGPLLRECEKWSTNFKLVVAYAQKPVVPRRRTASV